MTHLDKSLLEIVKRLQHAEAVRFTLKLDKLPVNTRWRIHDRTRFYKPALADRKPLVVIESIRMGDMPELMNQHNLYLTKRRVTAVFKPSSGYPHNIRAGFEYEPFKEKENRVDAPIFADLCLTGTYEVRMFQNVGSSKLHFYCLPNLLT